MQPLDRSLANGKAVVVDLGHQPIEFGRRGVRWLHTGGIFTALSDTTAATVKASSYYNIARVYEEQGEWQSALDSFQQALASKQNEAYTKGIARMNAKLGK